MSEEFRQILQSVGAEAAQWGSFCVTNEMSKDRQMTDECSRRENEKKCEMGEITRGEISRDTEGESANSHITEQRMNKTHTKKLRIVIYEPQN